jgi:hypothetical protein
VAGWLRSAVVAERSRAVPVPPERYERTLRAGWIVGEALRTLRARFWWVLSISAVVTVLASLAAWSSERFSDEFAFVDSNWLRLALVLAALFSTGSATIGSTLLTGVLDVTVGEHQHGRRRFTLRELTAHLPWITLIVADVLVALLRVGGFVLLVVPGFIVITLTAVVGPVIMLERHGAWRSIRRSVTLVRPYFWLTFGVVTVPLVLEALFAEAIDSLPFIHDTVTHLATIVLLEVPVSTFVALVEITLAYELIERDRPGTIARADHH